MSQQEFEHVNTGITSNNIRYAEDTLLAAENEHNINNFRYADYTVLAAENGHNMS